MRISQRDKRWSNVKLKNTSFTIGGHGCTVCSINMGILKFNPKSEIRPNDIAKLLKFTDSSYPLGEGLIIWGDNKEQFKRLGIEFLYRYYGNSEDILELIDSASEEIDRFVIVEVLRKDSGRHWLFCHGSSITWRGKGWACDDPINGKREWKTVGLGAPYVKITGCAIFKKLK